jgi:phosphatidylglycerophosphate synthase
MLDAFLRGWIDPPLNAIGQRLHARGVAADQVTVAGFAIGLGAAVAIAANYSSFGLGLIVLNRLCDGVDGAIARAALTGQSGPTDRGGFLDIALDFAFYAAIPLAFAVQAPAANALAAAFLLAAFLANGAAFLAFAAIAGKRGLTTSAQGAKSIYYVAGLAEGAETIVVFCAFCLWPAAFPWLAAGFAAVCIASAIARVVLGWRTFG